MAARHPTQRGFTLVEMIVVIVITGILGGIVAVFLKAPVQGYVDSARRAELADIADTALRRIARDLRLSVANSVRSPNQVGSTYLEFLPTKAGGRYRADALGGAGGCNGVAGDDAGDVLSFAAPDTCFEIVGPAMSFAAGDQIVLGNTNWNGDYPYRPTTDALSDRRAYNGSAAGAVQDVLLTATVTLPAYAQLPSQRFQVVPGDQQAVTYACVGTLGALDANGDGQAKLVRYWGYGINQAQPAPPIGGGSSAVLADKISDCNIVMDAGTGYSRMGLVAIRLVITRGNESISLYREIHVDNTP